MEELNHAIDSCPAEHGRVYLLALGTQGKLWEDMKGLLALEWHLPACTL